jgi:hypothetical protein
VCAIYALALGCDLGSNDTLLSHVVSLFIDRSGSTCVISASNNLYKKNQDLFRGYYPSLCLGYYGFGFLFFLV